VIGCKEWRGRELANEFAPAQKDCPRSPSADIDDARPGRSRRSRIGGGTGATRTVRRLPAGSCDDKDIDESPSPRPTTARPPLSLSHARRRRTSYSRSRPAQRRERRRMVERRRKLQIGSSSRGTQRRRQRMQDAIAPNLAILRRRMIGEGGFFFISSLPAGSTRSEKADRATDGPDIRSTRRGRDAT